MNMLVGTKEKRKVSIAALLMVILALGALVALLATGTIRTAGAEEGNPPQSEEHEGGVFYRYLVKIVCVPHLGPSKPALTAGNYRTAVNIWNPLREDAQIFKQLTLPVPQGGPQLSGPFIEEHMPGRAAWDIDCPHLARDFGLQGVKVPGGKAYLHIVSFAELEVTAVYTARAGKKDGLGTSIDVETIRPRVQEFRFRHDQDEDGVPDDVDNCPEFFNPEQRDDDQDGVGHECDPDDGDPDVPGSDLPDLTVTLVNPPTTVSCPGGAGDCTHTFDFEVTNIGTAGSPGTDVKLNVRSFDGTADTPVGSILFPIPELGPGTSTGVLTGSIGPGEGTGANCYGPDCITDATVDPSNTVPESDELNNGAERVDLG